ncbi:MAG: DNA-binding response regulator [Legionellales bacterium]|nr:DNA-binding response regulator [Legionellales bacterium]
MILNKLLIVDDDPKITELMGKFLIQHGFQVYSAANAEQMEVILSTHKVELIILDIMLPGKDGFAICEQLRLENNPVPVLMLTAMGEDESRIRGFKLGADDYLTKPFNPEELLARIQAILRRSQASTVNFHVPHTLLRFNGWTINKLQRVLLSPEGAEVTLTDGEYRLLEALAERAPEVVSRDELLHITEGREAGPYDRSIDVRVSRLRQKLDDNSKNPKLIKTIRSGGYLLSADVVKDS